MNYTLSADAGGTFLDLVVVNSDGQIGVGKALHTSEKPEQGIFAGIAQAAAPFGVSVDELLKQCRLVFHGTTVTTNGIIERAGARTGLLCTRGFEDTLGIGRVRARSEGLTVDELSRYAHVDRPPAIVPFALIRGIGERLDKDGRVLAPLDPDEVERAVASLVAEGVEAIAIAFLHSYANPAHELAAKDIVAARFPSLHVVTSSEIAPVLGEFERTNTAVVNAFLNPLLDRHLDRLSSSLDSLGYDGKLLVMQSIGGVADAAVVRNQSVTTLLSGPVGGIIGAQQIGALIGEPNMVTTDMGGTSFDVGVIVDGKPRFTNQTTIHRQVLLVPAVDIETIGAGGGSIISISETGTIQIGPESAGARPGPACYGLGGERPTITDADVVLGFLDPQSLRIGDHTADASLAVEAVERHVARPLGMSAEEAADAIVQIVNNRMADLVRKATVERGHDPRDFVILAYGGSGPTHCTGYAAEIGAKKVVIPPFASVLSAYGIAHSDVKHSFVRSLNREIAQGKAIPPDLIAAVNDAHAELVDQAKATDASRHAALNLALDVQFKGQMTEIAVHVDGPFPLDEAGLHALVARFKHLYEQNYGAGASSPASEIMLNALRADLTIPILPKYQPRPSDERRASGSPVPRASRRVYWGRDAGWIQTPVFTADDLLPGDEIDGRALIELFKTTVPILAGQRAELDAYRNLIVVPSRRGTEGR